MRLLITGGNGQLGRSLQEVLINDQVFATDLPELDLTVYGDTRAYFEKVKPEVVIHCAAMTQVDECELNPQKAYLANVIATKNVVNATALVEAALVYISTDYVFDGMASQPYGEYAPTNPVSVYGQTKLQGEMLVRMLLNQFYIVRTSWLFGDQGHNFVRTILKLGTEREELQIVNDQMGSPTYALDLAKGIDSLIRTRAYGIYHGANAGACTWFDFAKEILELSGNLQTVVKPMSTKDLKRPAPRPQYSILARDGFNSLEIVMPHYREALERFLQKNF